MIDKKANDIKQTRKPGNYKNNMQSFDIEHDFDLQEGKNKEKQASF